MNQVPPDRGQPVSAPAEPARPSLPVLYLVVCAAAPAVHAERLVRYARSAGWDAWVIATQAAIEYLIDPAELERASGHPVRTGYRLPSEFHDRRASGRPVAPGEVGALPRADAAIVAPATYNTINKLAAGIADSFPLSTLTELMGCRVPIVVLPYINSAFAATAAFGRSVTALREEGVRILLGPGGFEPHPPRAGEQRLAGFPWHRAVDELAGPGD